MKVNLAEAKLIAAEDTVPTRNRKITAIWLAQPWCLCHGEWIIQIDGEKIELPEDIKHSEMGTYGIYQAWRFGEDYKEIWDSYEDGLPYKPWVKENAWWLEPLNLSESETEDLYGQISEYDWRHGSCGGCI